MKGKWLPLFLPPNWFNFHFGAPTTTKTTLESKSHFPRDEAESRRRRWRREGESVMEVVKLAGLSG